jgi:hypothetical protein
MGMFASAASKRLAEPQQVVVGPWLKELLAAHPFLNRDELCGLAGMRALLSVDQGKALSTYLTEGKHNEIEFANASTRSLLRCEADAGSGTQLTCGASSPDGMLPTDWTLRYSVNLTGTAVVDVPNYRTREGKMSNGSVMTAAREAVMTTLAEGVNLHLSDGLPNTDELVQVRSAPSGTLSPFDHDYLDVLDASHRRPVVLPAGAGPSVLAAMSGVYPPPESEVDGCISRVDLAAGRPYPCGTVALRHREGNDELVIDLPPDLPPVERQRSYRAALLWMRDVARALPADASETSEAIETQVGQIGQGTQRADRYTGWTASWGDSTPAEVVPVAAGHWYPIGIRVLTPLPTNFQYSARTAQQWVGLRKRTFARGITRKSQDKNRIFTTRRPGILIDDNGKYLPYVRYGSQFVVGDEVTSRVQPKYGWFWEVKSRWVPPVEGVEEGGLLLLTGWSHADGIIGYGVELLAMLRTFAEIVTHADPQARIQTLYLAS